MSMVIVCRTFDGSLLPKEKSGLQRLSEACAKRIDEVRLSGGHVIHHFSKWPGERGLLAGCHARADEPVTFGKTHSLLACEALFDLASNHTREQIELLGLIDIDILGCSMGHAKMARLKLVSEPGHLRILTHKSRRKCAA